MEIIWQKFHEGGTVMYVLLALSFGSWLVIIERLIVLSIEKKRIHQLLREGFPDETGDSRGTIRYLKDELNEIRQQPDELYMNTWLDGLLNVMLAAWQRGFVVLELTATLSPLLGLLGTVLGMVEVFQVISIEGATNASVLSSGISKALNTTVMGLLVAMPALAAHTMYERKSEMLATSLEKFLWSQLSRNRPSAL